MSVSSPSDNNVSDAFLPYGLHLQLMLKGSVISEAEMKRALLRRGIVVQVSDKDTTIPLLMTCLLSPREFEDLREKQIAQEDSLKHITQSLVFGTDEFSLLKVVENRRFVEELVPKHSNYKVIGAPSFTVRDSGNELVLDYSIERTNRTKDWTSLKTTHTGTVSLRKEGTNVRVTMEYTSTETKELNDRVMKRVTDQFKAKGLNPQNGKVQRIIAGDFDNAARARFLLALTRGDENDVLRLKQVTHVNLGPDSAAGIPENLQWMEERVRSMILYGKQLHSLEFFTDPKYHEFLVLEQLDAVYHFQYKTKHGTCVIRYGFPSYLRKRDAAIEFVANVTSITWDEKRSKESGPEQPVRRREVERFLLAVFDKMTNAIAR